MKTLIIFIWIYAAMIATSYWEAYVEGKNAWDKGKLGWKLRIGNFTFLTAYHFSLFWMMWPLLLTLPLIIYGWDARLFGILLSAYFSGLILEDFMWYVVHPEVKMSDFIGDFANYYPRVSLGKIKIPISYFVGLLATLLSWYFLWR